MGVYVVMPFKEGGWKFKMNAKNTINTLIVFILMLAMLSSASALSEDFLAQSASSINIGECSTGSYKIQIINTGDISSAYGVFQEGSAASWTSYAQASFILKPGEMQEVFVNIKAPCDKKGRYDLDTVITTKLGLQKKLQQEIEITDIENVEVTPKKYSSAIKPCETAVYSFDVKNKGDFPEIYEFSAEPNLEGITFSENNVSIRSGETKSIFMYITPPCEAWGEFTFDVITEAKLSKTLAETKGFSLLVERGYEYSLAFGDFYIPEINKTPNITEYNGAYSLCEYETRSIPVLIENEADVMNAYSFELEGPRWASLGGDFVELIPGQSAYVNINLNPSKPMKETANITLNVISELGQIEKSETRTVNVDVCYLPVIAEGVDKIKTYYNESTVELGIQNTGSKNAEYELIVQGADWITLEPSTVNAAPQEYGIFNLNLNPVHNITEEGTHTITISALSDNKVYYTKDIDVKLKEPRFANMILDEYLIHTILFIVFLIIVSAGAVLFVVYLENTKEERAKKAEKRKAEKEKKRLKKKREKERKQREKEKIMLRKQKEKEIKQKEKEKRKLQKQQEIEKKKLEKQKKLEKIKQEKEKKQKQKEAEKIKKAEAKARASKEKSEKPKKEKKPFNLKWLKWAFIVLIISAAAILLLYLIYKVAVNFDVYGNFVLWGFAASAVLVIIIWIIDSVRSRWVKEQTWKKIVSQQKGVVELSWKKGLGEIIIKFKSPLDKARIKVKRSKKPTFISAGEKVYQYFDIRKSNFENRDIEKVLFRFRIKKRWLLKNSIPEDTIKLAKYNNEKWLGLKTEPIKEDKKYVYFETASNGCSIFAITGKPKPVKAKKTAEKTVVKKQAKKTAEKNKPVQKKKSKKKPLNLKWLWLTIFIAIIASGLGFAVFYAVQYMPSVMNRTDANITENASLNITDDTNLTEPVQNLTQPEENITENETASDENNTETIVVMPEDEEGIPVQVWDEDTVHIINLSKYFSDPDEDELVFKNSELENFIVEYEGGTAKIKPKRNWFGEETVVFTADDGKGANVSSNEVKLVVRDVEEPPRTQQIKEFFSEYSDYIMMGILILVIVILLIEFRKPIMKFLEED